MPQNDQETTNVEIIQAEYRRINRKWWGCISKRCLVWPYSPL